MSAHPEIQRDIEVSPSKLTAVRAGAVFLVVAIVVVVTVLYVFVRDPLLVELGRISGSSRTLAVVLGWSVWGVPLLLSLLFGWWARDHTGLPRHVWVGLLILLLLTWLPAVALLPGGTSGAQQQLASQAISNAPVVASSLLAGIAAGAGATFLSLPALALTVVPRRRHPPRLASLDRVARPLALVLVSLLGLGGALAFGRATAPGIAVSQLWPRGRSFTFNDKVVRVLGASRSGGCAGIVGPARALTVLQDDGCGGSERGLFTDSNDNALVSVAVIAMPTSGLAHDAAVALTRLGNAYTVPLATPAGYGRSLNHRRTATVVQDLGSEVVVLEDGHADGRPRYVDTSPERTLGDAVMSTLSVGIIGT